MSSLVIDAHYDLLFDVFRLRRQGERQVIERFYLEDLRTAGIDVLVCSLFVPDDYLPESALRTALSQIGMLHAELDESPGLFALCRNLDEVQKAHRSGQVALLLSFEGADPIGFDLHLLKVFYELGVRFLGLVWSRRNFVADGCHFTPKTEGTVGGLTAFGVELVVEAERLGMILDVSHLNDAGLANLLTFSKGPLIASHSNCRALCPVPRNLTDEQLTALAQRGGVVGLNNMLSFVYPKDEGANTNAEGANASGAASSSAPLLIPEGQPLYRGLLDHARHMIEVMGEDHVGLGLDLCEFQKPEAERIKSAFPSYRHVLPFLEALDAELGPAVAEKIKGGNWLRILERLT
ncbi:MAG: membrane dipeptidase [Fretibacterium sp.]|nr:membrane dipeptidase [Fretibacterium sp.]